MRIPITALLIVLSLNICAAGKSQHNAPPPLQRIIPMTAIPDAITCISSDRLLAFRSESGIPQVVTWDIASGKRIKTIQLAGCHYNTKSIFSNVCLCNHFVAAFECSVAQTNNDPSGYFDIWNADTGQLIRSFHHTHGNLVGPLTLSPDGGFLVVATEKTIAGTDSHPYQILIFNNRTGSYKAISKGSYTEPEGLGDIIFTPDSKRLVCSDNHSIKLFDVPSYKLNRTINAENNLESFHLSQDGKSIAALVLSDTMATFYTIDTVHWKLHKFPQQKEGNDPADMALMPDGKALAIEFTDTDSNGNPGWNVHLLKTMSGVEVKRIHIGHMVKQMHVSSSGKYLVTLPVVEDSNPVKPGIYVWRLSYVK